MLMRREILATEVAKKLRLEERFKQDIRKIFIRIATDFRSSIARTGQAPPLARYRKAFDSTLEEHYRRCQKEFSGAILVQNNVLTFTALRQKQNKKADDDESRIKELIAAIFLLWNDQHAPVQADIIIATTIRDMQDAIDQGRQALREENKPSDNRSLALLAAVILKRILRGRIDLIAVTETQTASETAKAIEASTAAKVFIPGIPVPREIVPLVEPTIKPTTQPEPEPELEPQDRTPQEKPQAILKKSWISLRDKRVRHTHVEADRTYSSAAIPVNEAFIVGSSRMMYPGDTSLGAPIREIAHCRCSAQYLF